MWNPPLGEDAKWHEVDEATGALMGGCDEYEIFS